MPSKPDAIAMYSNGRWHGEARVEGARLPGILLVKFLLKQCCLSECLIDLGFVFHLYYG